MPALPTPPVPSSRRTRAGVLAVAALAVTAACSSPGSGSSSAAPSSGAGSAPAAAGGATAGAAQGSASTGASGAAGAAPSCGTAPVTMTGYFETGFPLPKALTDEFTKQYPNVTWSIREDQFAVITQNAPRTLADNPPDLMRLPQMSELAKDHLLLDLDSYAKAFGWDQWPASQLEQLRISADGSRGTGPLYANGLNFSMTGIFYNKKLAAQIGMTKPPATVAELDSLLQKAKSAGITPIAQFNGGATGGFAFPLQNLMAAYGPAGPINDWIFDKPGATIDTPSNQQAAAHLQEWISKGYFAKDVNSLDYAAMMSRFIGGKSLFIFDGDWESGNLDKQMAGNVGFFLMPPAQAGGKQAAMSAPLTYGIAAKAKHADCAAFFLNWVATNQQARTIAVQVGGSHPMGAADAYMPPVKAGTVTAATLAAGAKIGQDNGAMDFIANATGAVYAKSWTPNLQRMVGGQQTGAKMLASVQKDYQSQLGH
ncbi:carbohydrate ABC transporter substrate-binding protein (CUT1 family) [Motilibacter rhizosphaerae]|uniref:Carbohydrate ABC transporter substrate-binding protein (CUT1 family) n=1 Tax=Motilibacter rhizosphaerae TaxID=598652 RepID=A0A4V2F556_9ACTN|nr:extracellular solute-binding protein [Motilibacter rhizosphaerae]RZS91649.1 carbohydrate ABC transporter substrate-binding protein (CUT1 family) [Motilibacter rhizosphaerae]